MTGFAGVLWRKVVTARRGDYAYVVTVVGSKDIAARLPRAVLWLRPLCSGLPHSCLKHRFRLQIESRLTAHKLWTACCPILETEIPAHFVDRVRILQDKEIILDISSDISLSEDPSFTFHYYNSGGPIVVEVSDSTGKKYSKKWNLNQIISRN